MTTQLVSEFAADDFVPFIATRARAAIASSPSANTAMRLLLTDFGTSAGTMTAGTIVGPVTSQADADAYAGVGSNLARDFAAARRGLQRQRQIHVLRQRQRACGWRQRHQR